MDTSDNKLNKAYNKAIKLLDLATHTEKSLSTKLYKKGYSKKIVSQVITILKKDNLINDEYYARIYAENLVKYKKNGPAKVLMKLKAKGINDEKANVIMDEIINNNGGEEEIIKENIRKNIIQIKRLFENKGIGKIKYKLFNSGFSIQIINKAIDKLSEILGEK